MSDSRKSLCVIFDIDETLIHFINKKYREVWDNNTNLHSEFTAVDNGNHIILFRPYLKELFQYFASQPHIKVGLWTYSEQDYSQSIATTLIREFQLDPNFFLFTWGAEQMDESENGLPKDLEQVYTEFPQFNKFNTFIVDDLPGNIMHDISKDNCVLIQPFAPFGIAKQRSLQSESVIQTNKQDTILKQLQGICQKVLTYIDGCSEEDIDDSFTTEPVFAAKRVKKMKMGNFCKKFAYKFIRLMTIGKPYETDHFIMLTSSQEKYGPRAKGGGKKKRTQKRKKGY